LRAIFARAAGAAVLLLAASAVAAPALSDASIKRELMQQSIASYPGSCPCPYNTDRRGYSCGRRSAYSRPGGYAPLCYESDVTDEMITTYRQEHHQ